MPVKILGISGSLRNARFGRGSTVLVEEIKKIKDETELKSYLQMQTKIRVEDFISAGRDKDLPFDITYKNLQKAKGDKGLSNSEAALAAGLWGAHREGVDIAHLGLSTYFPMNGSSRNLDDLKKNILASDALLISGPVYFGDRSSLVNEFIEFLNRDAELKEYCRGRLYAGITVGAKRNGGQETTLIYQIIDMTNLNMLAVGNSAKTTSQYGGTVLAGDVGTAWADDYGLDTSIGTGARLVKVTRTLKAGDSYKLKSPVKIGVWIMQDTPEKRGLSYFEDFIKRSNIDGVDYKLLDLTQKDIARCIACDLCPTHHGPRDEYACIIGKKQDYFVQEHEDLMDVDAVLIAAYSPVDRAEIESVYQRFFERTRYVRRGHYMLSDRLAAPFVISELNANQNLHIRILTSMVRHHTILHHPLIGVEANGKIINDDYCKARFDEFAENAVRATKARLIQEDDALETNYNPVGYVISRERNEIDDKTGKNAQLLAGKQKDHSTERDLRLEKVK
ncbi:NAD(P)H-dependent oxidoreductase [Curvivirga aplysinae]|uniref:NAD(P)H-dependent oxidoreductase n=1 Tax=Curvivirga aplysinae TaxID=2529852 RepID=UPI001C3F88CF|nr:NAD(P)H-dependent oxidoreductase [Curvivirga aplysinae]